MKILAVGDFKAHFSDILKDIQNGEEIAISYGKRKEIVAVLVPKSKYFGTHKRKLGILKGKANFSLSSDFEISEEKFLN